MTADCLISRKRIDVLAAYGREGPPDFINRLVFVDDTAEPLVPKVGDACHAALSAAWWPAHAPGVISGARADRSTDSGDGAG